PPQLCGEPAGRVAAWGDVCGQDSEGCQARRPAGGATDEVRPGPQHEDGAGTRDHIPPDAPGPGGRGDPIAGRTPPAAYGGTPRGSAPFCAKPPLPRLVRARAQLEQPPLAARGSPTAGPASRSTRSQGRQTAVGRTRTSSPGRS